LTLNTVALELVAPNLDDGGARALDDAHKVVRFAAGSGT
jgi:hypothetical protein